MKKTFPTLSVWFFSSQPSKQSRQQKPAKYPLMQFILTPFPTDDVRSHRLSQAPKMLPHLDANPKPRVVYLCSAFHKPQLFALEKLTEPREILAFPVFFKYYQGLHEIAYTVISAGGSRKVEGQSGLQRELQAKLGYIKKKKKEIITQDTKENIHIWCRW